MKIDSYNVAMQTNHFNLDFSKTEAQVNTSNTDSSNGTTNSLAQIQVDESISQEKYLKLSKELSKAVLKNINNESRKLLGDRVLISNTYAEAESLAFNINALIQTEGKEIEVSLDINISRSFVQTTNISIETISKAVFRDPLILSFDEGFPMLDSKTFSFDIDSDGTSNQISLLKRNSAFLVLDKNENSKIDDGSELFGTSSGDGFADLAKYDDDKNGWIDENDAIFNKLQVWQKSEGKDTLIALGEVGIGAIFLGDTSTPFSLKSDTNASLGKIRSSSMFLYEDGRAGIISHIDFAIDVKTDESLEGFKGMNDKRRVLLLNGIYTSKQSGELTSDSESELSKLQKKLSALNDKLQSASEEEKSSISQKIAIVNTQMITLLSR